MSTKLFVVFPSSPPPKQSARFLKPTSSYFRGKGSFLHQAYEDDLLTAEICQIRKYEQPVRKDLQRTGHCLVQTAVPSFPDTLRERLFFLPSFPSSASFFLYFVHFPFISLFLPSFLIISSICLHFISFFLPPSLSFLHLFLPNLFLHFSRKMCLKTKHTFARVGEIMTAKQKANTAPAMFKYC
jgi:hypothetical protein